MNLWSRFASMFQQHPAAKQRRRPAGKSYQPMLDNLEGRLVLSTVSSITASFNGTAIPAGNTVWFNSSFTASGLPKAAPATLHVQNAAIDFSSNGVPYHVAVPNSVVVLTPGAKTASTTFDPTDNDWDVSAPSGGAGDIFLGGVALPVPNGLPGGVKNLTWSGDFWSDTAGITVNWEWAAASYKSFSSDYNALGVKAVDNNTMTAYHNSDQSGAPEAFKTFVMAGATGGGGTNFTGNFSKTIAVKPTLGDGMQDYPYASSNPLTSVAFNESTVLRAANLDAANGFFQVWYSDEHALALGIGSVVVKTAAGTTTTNYPIAPLTSNPGAAYSPAVGTTATSGDQAGTDVSGRPMAPALFITDITNNPNDRSGDWQMGGKAYMPDAVFGTWKSFTKTVDYTTATPTVTVTTGLDPAKNNWNLGPGSDAAPAGLSNEGYGSEIRWDLNAMYRNGVLLPGHNYRFYVMVHDGDQNKSGGDSGQASFQYNYPGPANAPASIAGFVYEDDNNNGVHDAGDMGIYGVVITLYDTNHNIVAQTTTNYDGSYSFTGLAAGNYTMEETQPEFYFQGANNVGSLGGSVVDDVFSFSLNPGDNGTDYNFGELLSGPGS